MTWIVCVLGSFQAERPGSEDKMESGLELSSPDDMGFSMAAVASRDASGLLIGGGIGGKSLGSSVAGVMTIDGSGSTSGRLGLPASDSFAAGLAGNAWVPSL